jgi:hypothetical protein
MMAVTRCLILLYKSARPINSTLLSKGKKQRNQDLRLVYVPIDTAFPVLRARELTVLLIKPPLRLPAR